MSEFDENSGEDTDELWGLWDGQCQACDRLGRVNDLLLCEECATMLDRDLIRQRDWAYSAMAFGVPPEHREELRRQIIAQFGEGLELIAAPEETRKGHSSSPSSGRKRRQRSSREWPA